MNKKYRQASQRVCRYFTPGCESGALVYQSGAARGAARLVRPKITVIIRPKCKHFVLYSNSYLGVLNNYIVFTHVSKTD